MIPMASQKPQLLIIPSPYPSVLSAWILTATCTQPLCLSTLFLPNLFLFSLLFKLCFFFICFYGSYFCMLFAVSCCFFTIFVSFFSGIEIKPCQERPNYTTKSLILLQDYVFSNRSITVEDLSCFATIKLSVKETVFKWNELLFSLLRLRVFRKKAFTKMINTYFVSFSLVRDHFKYILAFFFYDYSSNC